jgi:hypothetical protein
LKSNPRHVEPAWARLPFHPVLLGFALVAVAYLQTDVSVWAALRPLLAVLLLSITLLLVAYLVVRDANLAGLLATAVIVLLRTSDLPHAAVALALLCLAALALGYFARVRRASVLASATRLLNIGSVALIAVLILQAVASGIPSRLASDLRSADPAGRTAGRASATDPPDMYLIMLEDYPRADTLQRLFAFDNSAFLNSLKTDGFSVASNSRSNYMYTALNLTAVLQMNYVTDLPALGAWKAGTTAPSLRGLINDNPVFDRLRSAGYTIYSSASRWESETVRAADVYCGADQLNEFEVRTIRDSLVGSLLDVVAAGWQAGRDRSVVNAEVSCVDAAARAAAGGPRFVLGHIEGPHIPVVFDSAGGPAPLSVYSDTAQGVKTTQDAFRRAYVAELQYLNRRILELVAEIRRTAVRPPVIIVMSDEGSESRLDWQQGARSDLRERFGTLFAASTPGHPSLFGDAPTTVNVFPTLLNAYLGTSLATWPARFFVSSSAERLDVTEIPDPFASP